SAAVAVFDRDRVGTGSQATECSACSKIYGVFRECEGRSSTRTRDSYAAGRTTKAGNIGLRTNRGPERRSRLCDRDRLGRGAAMSILNRDCVGTRPEAAESTTRTKGSAIDRVTVGRSSTRARNSYAGGGTTEARDIGLRTDRGIQGCRWLSDRDRLRRGATIGVLDCNGV